MNKEVIKNKNNENGMLFLKIYVLIYSDIHIYIHSKTIQW